MEKIGRVFFKLHDGGGGGDEGWGGGEVGTAGTVVLFVDEFVGAGECGSGACATQRRKRQRAD